MSRIRFGPALGLQDLDEILLAVIDRPFRAQLAQAAHFSSDPAVAKTRAPKWRASWIAVVPMPDDPPWTRNRSPACKPPRMKTLVQTVKKVSGRQRAASASPCPPGTGSA
jgi:hypothetical protein